MIVIAVGDGMPGLRGIAAKRVKGRRAAGAGPQVVTEAMIFGAEDQGVCQVACIEIGAQAVIG